MDEPSRRTCAMVDARENHSCLRCGISLYSVRGARHHRKMRSQAEKRIKHLPSNLILVCAYCHDHIHANPSEAYRNGWLLHSYQMRPDAEPVLSHKHGWILLDDEGHWTPIEEPTISEES